MASQLEKPANDDELYLARDDEVPATRPLMTGDVVADVDIPGVAASAVGMLVTHPCSMRSGGVALIERLHVALVEPCEPIAWASCPRDRMPLPALKEGSFHVVRLDQLGMVESQLLEVLPRIACLSERGVNLLQQRVIWYFTRLVAPTESLNELFAAVFDEIDLQEEWVDVATGYEVDPAAAAQQFHEWIRADDATGVRRQDRLKSPQDRAAVRRELKASLDVLYGLA